jgi:hypothetical protein
MWRHALRARLVDPRADPNRLHALTRHWMLVPVFYGLAFALASSSARVSLFMYVLLLLYYSLPGPAVVRWLTGRRAAAALRAVHWKESPDDDQHAGRLLQHLRPRP